MSLRMFHKMQNSSRTKIALKSVLALVVCTMMCVTGTACDDKPKAKPTAADLQAAQAAHEEKNTSIPTATKAADGSWNIRPDGSRFEPPIKPADLPQGVWYCDMGTVHYAQSEAGDQTCKLCKMKLKEWTGGESAPNPTTKPAADSPPSAPVEPAPH